MVMYNWLPEDLLISLFAAVPSPANLGEEEIDDDDDDDDDGDGDADDENLAVAFSLGTRSMTWALPVLHMLQWWSS